VDECIVGSYIDEYGMAKIESKIILKENTSVTAGDIRRFLKQKLGSDKIPKRILFVDTIAKTVTLKKIRKVVDTNL
jgi:acyl-CoA synthetase (AMP-forming)/AMP-acid ligase II